MTTENATYTAFCGDRLLASGKLTEVLLANKQSLDRGEPRAILIFEDQTGQQIDFDLRGTWDEVLARLPQHPSFTQTDAQANPPTGPGRPKLGVVCREVSLLPRHWEWLAEQPGGSSAALRRLVDEARKRGRGSERARKARDAASNFMWVMAGNRAGFEEASRALFANELERLKGLIRDWPTDIRAHTERLIGEYALLRKEAEAGFRSNEGQPS